MVPIVAYNFGAQKPKRIIRTIGLSILYAEGVMLLGFLVFQLGAHPLLGIFNASDAMLEIGIPALRLISISFLLAGFDVVCSSVFQALGHGVLSLLVSVSRQLVVLLPAAWILAEIGGLSVIWWCFPIAEVAACVISTLFLSYVYKKEIQPLAGRKE